MANLSILHAPFLLGMLFGTAVIYWFTGASIQAVITGAYRAVAFIKRNMKLDGQAEGEHRGLEAGRGHLHPVRPGGDVQHLPDVFFMTLGAAFIDPFFFVGYLIGLAISGLFQAIFMANAGGAWDNAKKIVETELREKGTPCTPRPSSATPWATRSRTPVRWR